VGLPACVLACTISCEKDDICVDGDTPLLIVTFYSSSDPTVGQSVNKLRVIGIDNGGPVPTFSDRSTTDSIALPLRTNQNNTGFIFIKDSASDASGVELGNADTVYLNYDIQSKFVSRACGFTPIFEGLSQSLVFDNNNWIDSLYIQQSRIENSNTSHVSIFY
jgi:hypothetical protein